MPRCQPQNGRPVVAGGDAAGPPRSALAEEFVTSLYFSGERLINEMCIRADTYGTLPQKQLLARPNELSRPCVSGVRCRVLGNAACPACELAHPSMRYLPTYLPTLPSRYSTYIPWYLTFPT